MLSAGREEHKEKGAVEGWLMREESREALGDGSAWVHGLYLLLLMMGMLMRK